MKSNNRILRSGFSRFGARRASADDGLTLIEVLAAMIIVVIVALAGAGLTINGLNTATAQERNQVAVTIANGQMEAISGWTVANNSGTGVSYLYTGRCQSNVTAAFTTYASVPGVSQTYPVWDPSATTAGTCSSATFPVTTTSTQNGTQYTITTILGACYETLVGGSCGTISGQSTNPTTTPAGYTALIRVIVYVTWTAGSTCAANGCSYETTSFADAHADPQWVTHS